MENEEDFYDQDLEDIIVRIITKFKNRPCYQNLFIMLVRGGEAIEMDELKEFINKLVDRSILLIKGNDERGECFCLGSFLNTDINNIVDNPIRQKQNQFWRIVCMYVCMHVCTYVCMYVCMNVYLHVCIYVYMYACM